MDPVKLPNTSSQAKASEEFETACRRLAMASETLKMAEADYQLARTAYAIAWGAAKQAGVISE
jgi:hypothetical protein